MRIPKIQVHPKTGAKLEPIYVTRSGRVVWPQLGAAPDDPDDSGNGSEGDDDADDDGASGSGNDDGSGDGDDGKVSREDLETVVRRMKAADRRASDAEAKLKKIEDAKKDELTKANERAEAAEARVKELESKVREGELRDAFKDVDGYAWKRPAAALRIAQADGYLDDVLTEEGVDKKLLAKKVKEFSEAYPELLRSDDGNGSTGNGKTPPPPTGAPAGSGKKKPAAPDDSELRKRYGNVLR